MSKLCVACKKAIPSSASKCAGCGTLQNFLRYLDIGNTSLSLIIAALSVLALASDSISKVVDNFVDHTKASVVGHIINVDPSHLTVFIKNYGPGSAIVDNSALCSVWPTKTSDEITIKNEKKYIVDYKYPTSHQVVNRYLYSYGNTENMPTILVSGQGITMNLLLREVSVRNNKGVPEQNDLVASYCSVIYRSENGESDWIINKINPIHVSFFSLTEPAVKRAIKKYGRVLE